MIDTSWMPAFYKRERTAIELRATERKDSFRERVDLMSWASEENQLHSLAIQIALSKPTRQQMWYMMRPAARPFARLRKDACPVCRDAYLSRDGNKYIHREYGHGAYMYHADDLASEA